MNNEDRKYLRSTERMRPSFRIFERMVKILESVQAKANQLLTAADKSLLETFKST